MPAPIIIKDLSGLSEGISGFGSALAEALKQRGEKNIQERRRQGLTGFTEGLETAAGDPNKIAQAYTQAVNAGADPAQLQGISQQYQAAKKNKAYTTAFDEAIAAGGIDTDAGKQAAISAFGRQGENPFELVKMFKPDKKGETGFDKKISAFKADSVIDYIQGGEESSKIFEKNLDFLEGNVENVGRMAAVTGGKAGILGGGEYGPFQTAAFSEYERVGNLVLEGVIKVFNKAGVLPVQKLKWIRDTFAISPFDTQEQIKGRISALRSLSKDTGAYQKEIGKLIDQYGENIPNSEFLKIQRNLNKTFDKFEKAYESPEPEQVYSALPTSGMEEGDLATETETEESYIWSGSRWVKQK